MSFTNERYAALREVFRGQRLPLAFVDLDAFDANVEYAACLAAPSGKSLRIGTKSMRCPALMERVLAHPSGVFRGFLTFTAEETEFLAARGCDDFLLAYPTLQPTDMGILASLSRQGRTLSVMADSLPHMEALDRAGREQGTILSACLEVDMSYRPLGAGHMHLGMRRSPVRTPEDALDLVRQARNLSHVKIEALMGYEGHIAGTGDDLPGQALKNLFTRLIKAASVREFSSRRQAVVRSLREEGVVLRLVNGGGSGSLASTLRDPSVSEATIGSGLYAPGLFHHFREVKYRPSAFFALQVVRVPAPGMITCAGGGYAASGPAGPSRLPIPVMPPGLKYLGLEGAGEVQTPLILPAGAPAVQPGDPVFCQHAKAGELCERFNELFLLSGGRIAGRVPTYRGEGMSFL